ncbi:hypothetical protein FSP39_022118 [Pinctada imbricata]|uniref:Neutral metalloproteinase n=1 Tax=Pinctada imbricata TaxID=66713 RepID=A0AA88XWU8_PINIB|nr:hypothetical protein FSP39_022118 [Pinctada imbricata]
MQELYKNVPVMEGSLTIEVTENGTITGGATGTLIQDIEKDLPDVQPELTEEKALSIAIFEQGDEARRSEIGDVISQLWIYTEEDKARLIYSVQYLIDSIPPKRPLVVIDAKNGEVLLSIDYLNDIDGCCSKSIRGYGGNEKYGKIEYGKSPYCVQPKQECFLENKYVRVVSMNHLENETEISQDTISYPCEFPVVNYENGAYSQALDAFFYGTIVSKMYEDWIGGFPLPSTGQIVLRIHYGVDYENAFWNGRNCTFGDGNTTFYPLASLDVIAHEIGHGVVQQNSMLDIGNESYALNEAFADIFGVAAKTFFHGKTEWSIGAQVMRNKPFLRSFEDPESEGSIIHTDNITIAKNYYDIGGIIRLALYNIVAKHNVSFKNAFRSFDRANKIYWGIKSTIQQAGCGVIKAAYDLGQNIESYENSFEAVGVVNCSIFDLIPNLKNDRWYNGIVVSSESQPVFKYRTKSGNGSVTIVVLSNKTKIEIRVDNDVKAARALNFNMFSGVNKLSFDADGRTDWYIGLFPVSGGSLNVSVLITFTCDPEFAAKLRARHECRFYRECDYDSFIRKCMFG